jgi:hypothetical protein
LVFARSLFPALLQEFCGEISIGVLVLHETSKPLGFFACA